MSKPKQDATLDDVSDDLQELKKDFIQLFQEFMDRNKEWLVTAKDEVSRSAGQAVKVAEKEIKTRPFYAMLIAFILGIVFTSFTRRS